MPHSLVLNFLPNSPIPPGFTSGKHLHALFLNLVSSVDTEMGNQLHANQGNKAFTLSPLQIVKSSEFSVLSSKRDRSVQNSKPPSQLKTQNSKLKTSLSTQNSRILKWQYHQPVAPNTLCWWRISLLDDRLFNHLSQLWLNLNPDHPWHLGPADLHITSILGTPQSTQPWANFRNYTQLYDQASDQERKLSLQFCTPTAFRQGKYDSAMPTPNRVFISLLRCWNHYSGLEFPLDIIETVQPSYFNIRTEIVTDPRSQFQHTGARFDPRNQFMGCVGEVTFRILGNVDSITIKQLNTLADFALYAGVGRKTPMGMGMTRRV